ncbi:hypothetical protein BHU09_02745 [Tannerella sp. oral taxon 808]|nr:hypothetical protein BHU09_02745 [Tannerella sp. oral taxon 808]
MKKPQEDYEAFVAKFERKRTSDDCYTPPEVYDIVLGWLSEQVDLAGAQIIRPFWPDTDYKQVEYPDGCVVVDNPPFSRFVEIVRWYLDRGVRFFLFAPHTTIFNLDAPYTRLVCGASVIYENGAEVCTSFASNLFGDVLAMSVPDLNERLKAVGRNKNPLPRYSYPSHVLTFYDLARCARHGVAISIPRSEAAFVRRLDSQQAAKKAIYGSGFLLSDRQAARMEAALLEADRHKAEKAAQEIEAHAWAISDRERAVIAELSKQAQ